MDVNDIGIALLRAVFAGLPFGAALALGVMLPVVVVGLSSATARLSASTRALLIVGAIVVGSSLSIAFSGRVLYSDSELLRNPTLAFAAQANSIIGIRISQTCTLLALLLSVAEIFRSLTSRFGQFALVGKLWLSFFFFYVISIPVAGVAGVFREPDSKYLYFVVVFTGLAMVAPKLDFSFWRGLRWLLLVPSLGSLICMLAAPQVVLLNDYEAFIPGLKSRLFGLSEHANGIGILAATALIIEFSTAVRARPSAIFFLAHAAVLVLSQSKTAWLATLVVLAVVRMERITNRKPGEDPWKRKAWLLLSVLGLAVLSVSAIVVLSSSVAVGRALEAKSVFTLTGRFQIWEITLAEFWKSPLFGYGPSLWDLRFRMDKGLPFAGQAHNQFVQIIGQAGVIGLASMLIYMFTLAVWAFRANTRDGGLTLALFILIVFRCMVESPLRMTGIMGWENVLHMLVLLSAASFGIKSLESSRQRGDSFTRLRVAQVGARSEMSP